jgi:hypothetical protein
VCYEGHRPDLREEDGGCVVMNFINWWQNKARGRVFEAFNRCWPKAGDLFLTILYPRVVLDQRKRDRQFDERTVRDCPDNRTELEWKEAVNELEARLQGHDKTCPTCGQSIQASHKYNVTETEEWLPGKSDLPRGRWALHAHTPTLRAARILQRFMGPRATVWVRTEIEGNSSSYKKVDGDKS